MNIIIVAVRVVGLIVAWITPTVQVPVEIPTTVIGLVAFVVASETGIIIFLLKQFFALTDKYAELVGENAKGAASIANGLSELSTAVQQGKNYDALERKIDELAITPKTAIGRNRKRQT